ncbi:hypothetical protein SEA_GOIB_12 [Gordonia phage Goib]|nr:hypothetical protein SEA_GOIB_12 [Gordonia phage Goib]
MLKDYVIERGGTEFRVQLSDEALTSKRWAGARPVGSAELTPAQKRAATRAANAAAKAAKAEEDAKAAAGAATSDPDDGGDNGADSATADDAAKDADGGEGSE